MQLENLLPTRLIKRYKRFLVDVELEDGSVLTAHCPNTGSMMGCLSPGNNVILSHSDNVKRKYPYTMEMIQVKGFWVGHGLPGQGWSARNPHHSPAAGHA